MLSASRTRAKQLGIPHNIDITDIIIPEYCPILNIKLEFNKGSVKNNSPVLDRKIQELGYTKGNVQVISHRANVLKSDMSEEVWKSIGNYMGWTN